ncbi:MAG TPA: twin-arginine translocase TatA/TatE family subunit [Actinomycetota bacterium]
MGTIGFIQNLGMGELFVILLLALMIFGPNKLPEIARSLGKAIRTFQAEGQKAADVLRSAVEDDAPRSTVGVIDRPDTPSSQQAPAEPAPEGTERIGAPDGPPAPHPAEPPAEQAPPEPALDRDARLLEDT